MDLLKADDTELRALIRKSQAQASVSASDIVDGEEASSMRWAYIYLSRSAEDDDDDAGSGSGSGSGDD
jgi:hypothetical protein